jgi:hypothetical protein
LFLEWNRKKLKLITPLFPLLDSFTTTKIRVKFFFSYFIWNILTTFIVLLCIWCWSLNLSAAVKLYIMWKENCYGFKPLSHYIYSSAICLELKLQTKNICIQKYIKEEFSRILEKREKHRSIIETKWQWKNLKIGTLEM